jgi:uncharacterized 2Fe-2S/4Fe-4S cluster protein (DUF4445 family)
MSKPPVKVVFLPSGLRGAVTPGTRLDEAARQLGADVQSLCGGQGKCAKCRVRIASPAEAATSLSPPTAAETEALSANELADGWRLACQAKVCGNVTVDVPEQSRAARQVICKAPGARTVPPDPSVRRVQVHVPPPSPTAPMADWERLEAVLGQAGETSLVTPKTSFLRRLPAALRRDDGRMEVVLDSNRRCIGIAAESDVPLAGVALDIGTTSLAAYLCDLESGALLATVSAINPQVVYGEDVISRIAHASMTESGGMQLQQSVVEAVNKLLAALCDKSGIGADRVMEMVCVGNTCMHHLFLGLDVAGLSRAPFVPTVLRSLDTDARYLGLDLPEGSSVHFLPVVSGFVGADTVGALLAVWPEVRDATVLLVDVGTNGEIVLVHRNRMVCASCATGPALEGATLRHGMRAAPGAIERVRIDPKTLEVYCHVIGDTSGRPVAATGICGSGIIDAAAQMVATGIVGPNGRINRSLNTSRLLVDGNRLAFVLVPGEQSATGRPIMVDQEDIRAVQMAKGAIHAAVRLLMETLSVETIDKVLLCGAFGSVIDPASALAIGLIPELPLERIRAAGNAAGDGARQALLNRTERDRADRLARSMEYIELTLHPRFQREFAMAMYFPHLRAVEARKAKR